MIRRLLLAAALAMGLMTVGAAAASANNGNVACLYNIHPLNVGLCVGI
ncbi:MAG: hypothetical protein JWN29_2404 [Acidimicrobiales bacterium]|nr:hypothetical protein [Acidimicrobiales bacterium]